MESGGQRIITAVAYGHYEEALGVDPYDDRGVVNRTHIKMLFRFRNDPDVRQSLNKAKNFIISESNAHKGRRFFTQGRYEEALHFLMNVINRDRDDATKNAEDYHLIGRILVRLYRHKEALSFLQEAAKLRGDAVDHFHLGNAYARLGSNEDAVKCFEISSKKRGGALDFQGLGRAHYELGEYSTALPFLVNAFKLDDTTDYQLLKQCRFMATKKKIIGLIKKILPKKRKPETIKG